MHIICVAEGFVDGLKRFEEHFNGKEYCNGKCKVRVREIKLYHFGFNECGKDEVLSDIKSMSRYQIDNEFIGQKDTTTELHDKFNRYIRYFRRFFKMIKPIEKELDRVPMGTFQNDMNKKGIWFNMALKPIGIVEDYKNDYGEEMV